MIAQEKKVKSPFIMIIHVKIIEELVISCGKDKAFKNGLRVK